MLSVVTEPAREGQRVLREGAARERLSVIPAEIAPRVAAARSPVRTAGIEPVVVRPRGRPGRAWWAPVQGVGHRRGPELPVGVDPVERGQIPDQVGSAPGVVGVDQVLVAGVAVADDGAGVAGQHPPASMSSLDRPPVCIAVRHSVLAAWTYSRPPAARTGSHRRAAPRPVRNSSRTRARNAAPAAGRRGARTPAINPVDTAHPDHRAHQPGGAGHRQVMPAQQLRRPGQHPRPVSRPPRHPGGGVARAVRAAQHGQARVMTRYSVTHGGGGGRTSVTCRRAVPITGAPDTSAPQPAQPCPGHR